jgi:hypothetical protein
MNHSRVDIRNTSISCGVVEISRLADEIEDVLFSVANHFYHPARGEPPAFVMWSNLGDIATNGHRFATRVHTLLGSVAQTGNALNPKTGAVICVWVWTVNHEPFKAWYKEEKVRRLKA